MTERNFRISNKFANTLFYKEWLPPIIISRPHKKFTHCPRQHKGKIFSGPSINFLPEISDTRVILDKAINYLGDVFTW